MIVKLSVEVHCQKLLDDGPHLKYKNQKPSRYRIYIDDDLMTERNWIWDQNTFICENLLVDLPTNSSHNIRVDVLNYSDIVGYRIQLGLGNLIVDGIQQDFSNDHRAQLSFTIA